MKKSYIGWMFAAVAVVALAICGVVITEVIYPGIFFSDNEEENNKPHILVMFSEAKSAYQFADCEGIIAKATTATAANTQPIYDFFIPNP